MNTSIIELNDRDNLAIQVGMQQNPIMDCWEVIAMLGNVKDKATAEKLAKAVKDILWEEFSVTGAKYAKSN